MTIQAQVTELASVLLAPNPGPMTLDGTNSYVLRVPASGNSSPAVVVDPGPDHVGHLRALADCGPIEAILVTHRHGDHTEGARRLHELTGAPVRAPRAADCIAAEPLSGGLRLHTAGIRIEVLATPGHTADSVSFHLLDDRRIARPGIAQAGSANRDGSRAEDGDAATGSVLTGDTVLGRGTTVIGIPDGTLTQYLRSLRLLASLGPIPALPAHGPQIADVSVTCAEYLAHREDRLDQVRNVLRRLGISARDATVSAVADAVYGDVDPSVRFAAEHSVAAQLAYLCDTDPA
jgi:glyoxylase-like metal-dependent hydrolase (beta-lactamase superfamily II)